MPGSLRLKIGKSCYWQLKEELAKCRDFLITMKCKSTLWSTFQFVSGIRKCFALNNWIKQNFKQRRVLVNLACSDFGVYCTLRAGHVIGNKCPTYMHNVIFIPTCFGLVTGRLQGETCNGSETTTRRRFNRQTHTTYTKTSSDAK